MRLFAASFLGPPSQEAASRFVEALVEAHRQRLRSVPANSVHFTHAFCGEVPDGDAGRITAAVREALSSGVPFEVAIGRPHVLAGGSRPRLVCADALRGAEAVAALSAAISNHLLAAFPQLALSPGRAPHVTLARFRKTARRSDGRAVTTWLERQVESFATADRISAVQIVESRLTPSGPVYDVIEEIEMRPTTRGGIRRR